MPTAFPEFPHGLPTLVSGDGQERQPLSPEEFYRLRYDGWRVKDASSAASTGETGGGKTRRKSS